MAVNRYYSATAVRTQLQAAISASSAVISVGATTGFPSSTPFTLLIDGGQVTEEAVTVTGVSGLNLNVTRGVDGTNAVTHDIGASVMHALTARDLREPQEHIAANSGVHGISGKVVGDTDVQGLTNKTINASFNTLLNIPKSAIPADILYTNATATLTKLTATDNLTTKSIVLGSVGDTTQRWLQTFYRNPNVGKEYERRDYVYAGSTSSGTASVLLEDGTEVARMQLTPTGDIQVRGALTAPLRTVVTNSDTGAASGSSVIVTAAGFTNGGTTARILNGVCQVNLRTTKTGSTLTPNASGGIGDTVVCTIGSAYRPQNGIVASASYSASSGGTYGGMLVLNTDGTVVLQAMAPNAALASGAPLNATFVFLV